MKKIFLISLILYSLFLILNTPVLAVTDTPSEKESTSPANLNLINELKERIASRVAQLKLVEKRGIIGEVKEVADTQITVEDLEKNVRLIDVDELTKFSSTSAEESFGISDIKKGEKIGVLGLYNKQSKRILARFINALILPKSLHGQVTEKDQENFTISVLSKDNKKTVVDIEKITKTFSYTKEDGLVKSGFSKIKESQRVIVIGFEDKEDKTRLIASRILLFPEIPVGQTPLSTESGKKITPLTR